jgi:integrase
MKVTIRQKAGVNYLYADISISGIRVKSSLSIAVKDQKFNPKTQTVQGGANAETNILIATMRTSIMEMMRHLQITGDLTKERIKEGIVKLRESSTNPTQLEALETYLYEYAKEHIERSKPTRKIGTTRHYKVSLNKIKSYEKKHGVKLRFNDVDLTFYNLFVQHCMNDLNLSNNSISVHVKNIKMWMNASLDDELHSNTKHMSKSFKKISVEADTIYLNEDELKRIKSAIFPNLYLDNVRDIFLLACYTGVRSQDYHKLNDQNFINDGTMLKVHTEKTDVEVIIPLHPIAKAVLDKYNGTPRVISNQKFNKYIKEVCRFVGLTDKVTMTRTYKGKKIAITKQKCDFVSSHTARRSFATNAYKAGVPTLAIMAITGHRTEKVFLKYIRVSKEEHASLTSKHSFFSYKAG